MIFKGAALPLLFYSVIARALAPVAIRFPKTTVILSAAKDLLSTLPDPSVIAFPQDDALM